MLLFYDSPSLLTSQQEQVKKVPKPCLSVLILRELRIQRKLNELNSRKEGILPSKEETHYFFYPWFKRPITSFTSSGLKGRRANALSVGVWRKQLNL